MWSADEWDRFLDQSAKRGVLEPADIELLRGGAFFRDARGDGLDITALQRWLVHNTPNIQRLRRFEEAAEAMRGAVHGVNISISFRGLPSLSQRELYTYQVLLSEYEHGVADCLHRVLDRLRRSENLASAGSEEFPAAAVGDAAAIDAGAGPSPQTPEEFQWLRGPAIERRLREVREPAVTLPPPKEQRVLGRTEWGMRRLAGNSTRTGAPVQVLEIPWAVSERHAASAVEVSERIEALKQLTLSRYFLDYLGADFSSYSAVGLHFLPLPSSLCLRTVVQFCGPLTERNPLFRYWAREILSALRDFLYQCCYDLAQDLTLEHVFIDHEGITVTLQFVPFGPRRGRVAEDMPQYGPENWWRSGFQAIENRLITMFGHMLVELLYGRQEHSGPVQTMHELSPKLRHLISQVINARDTLDYFLDMMPGYPLAGYGTDTENSPDESWRGGLAGGLVGAGLDEYNTGEEYRLWWARPQKDPILVLPNAEGSADADDGGAVLREDWSTRDHRLRVGEDPSDAARLVEDVPRLRWEPNSGMFTIQELLAHPELQCGREEQRLMDAWDAYTQNFEANRDQHAKLGRFLDGGRAF